MDRNGFISTSLIYSLLIIFILIMLSTISIFKTNNTITSSIISRTKEKINNYAIPTYTVNVNFIGITSNDEIPTTIQHGQTIEIYLENDSNSTPTITCIDDTQNANIVNNIVTISNITKNVQCTIKNQPTTNEECFMRETNNGEIIIINYFDNQNNISNNTPCPRNVVIPATINSMPVTTIAENAFKDKSLTSVIIPDSITTIKENAFKNNDITDAILGNGITAIEDYAFYNNKLKSIKLPNGITTVEDYIFQYNELESIIFPQNLESIGQYAFANNTTLKNIRLNKSLDSISDNAFSNCHIDSVVIPSSVMDLGNDIFAQNNVTKVCIRGKETTNDFTTYPNSSPFGWANGYSDSDIVWECNN